MTCLLGALRGGISLVALLPESTALMLRPLKSSTNSQRRQYLAGMWRHGYSGVLCVQGLHTAKVKSKRALLVEEGVQFSGTRIKAFCVLDADELLAADAQATTQVTE